MRKLSVGFYKVLQTIGITLVIVLLCEIQRCLCPIPLYPGAILILGVAVAGLRRGFLGSFPAAIISLFYCGYWLWVNPPGSIPLIDATEASHYLTTLAAIMIMVWITTLHHSKQMTKEKKERDFQGFLVSELSRAKKNASQA